MISTYLIFNHLRVIHPQFRPKSRTNVLEPSQNFLSNQDIVFFLKHMIEGPIVEGPIIVGFLYGSLWNFSAYNLYYMQRGYVSILPYTNDRENTHACELIFEISKYRHDRSSLEIFETDGVDGRTFHNRGLTHLQLAEKPEAPEAERHLET
ncbi:neurotrimin-like isoform X2 [Vespula squamosa]|uniref:Neurotrimin-like isoform X2 n=1 Tax=Vespula squamosa TaxID=30214 RepID=A0ABD2B1P1_VESSQ